MAQNDSTNDQDHRPPSENEIAEKRRLLVLLQLRIRALCFRPEGQVRSALKFALENSGPTSAIAPILGALATIVDDYRDREAYEVAETVILALVLKSPREQEQVHAWHASRYGRDPTQNATAILDLAREVEKAVHLYARPNPCLASGPVAAQELREYLLKRFGEDVLGLVELQDLISRHSAKGATNYVTTAGIVARIMHHGGLLGASGKTFDDTLKRVNRVLARAAKRESQPTRKTA